MKLLYWKSIYGIVYLFFPSVPVSIFEFKMDVLRMKYIPSKTKWKMYELKIANAWYFNNWISRIFFFWHYHIFMYIYFHVCIIFVLFLFSIPSNSNVHQNLFAIFQIFSIRIKKNGSKKYMVLYKRLKFQHVSGRIHIESKYTCSTYISISTHSYSSDFFFSVDYSTNMMIMIWWRVYILGVSTLNSYNTYTALHHTGANHVAEIP